MNEFKFQIEFLYQDYIRYIEAIKHLLIHNKGEDNNDDNDNDDKVKEKNKDSYNISKLELLKEPDIFSIYNYETFYREILIKPNILYSGTYDNLNYKVIWNRNDKTASKESIVYLTNNIEFIIQSENKLEAIMVFKKIKKFIKKRLEKKVSTKCVIYQFDSNFVCYNKISNLKKRELDTLFLDDEVKNDIFNDVSLYLTSKNDYKFYGIPNKRVYLFYGPPGTGKTTTIKMLGSIHKLPIHIISFDKKIDDNTIRMAVKKSFKNSNGYRIVILEDVDSIFHNKDNTDVFSSITFSAFINLLDGIGGINKVLFFMTTNHIEKLDNSLLRASRIDKIVEFKKTTSEQITKIVEKYRPNESDEIKNKLLSKFTLYENTIAEIQQFLFDNRNKTLDKNIIETISKLKRNKNDFQNSENCEKLYS